MGIFENVKLALEGLKSNKMRSFLTMLGIIIGISSVIAILTIGKAMSASVESGFEKYGTTSMYVEVRPKKDDGWDNLSNKDFFKEEQIRTIGERFSDRLKSVTINGAGSSATVKKDGKDTKLNIKSTTPGIKDSQGLKMIMGRFLTDEDLKANREICIISDKAVKKIYSNDMSKAMGQELGVYSSNGYRVYRIVGIYKYEAASFGIFGSDASETTDLYIPLSVGNRQFGGKDAGYYQSFGLDVKSKDLLKSTADEIENFVTKTYYADNKNVEIKVETIEGAITQVNTVMGSVKLAISAIAAISLLVGGIGVMNILLVSVTERTREIGVRKALGAKNKDIRIQFITESIIICIIGGIIGVILGGAFGYVGSIFMKYPTLPSISSILLAVGFSMAIGIFFGYYPANKAAKLNPIDALRYE